MQGFKKINLIILIINISIIAWGGPNVDAEEGALAVSADIAIYSKYLWRGFLLDDDPVMQPGIYVSAKGFTASVWGSFDIDTDDSLNSDEVDYAMDYTHKFDNFSLSLGHTYYDFPPAHAHSKEFYIGGGLDIFLSPSLMWYHDYADEALGGGDGDYVVLELSNSLPLGESDLSLDFSGHAGYNNELFIDGEGADLALGMALTIPLNKRTTFSPNVNYSIPFGDLEASDDGNQDNEFYGGVALAVSF